MTTKDTSEYQAPSLELDPSFYRLDDEEKAFFQQLTGINDDEELKDHIIRVQAKAYKIFGYPCIRSFAFVKLKIARLPAYRDVQALRHKRENPILFDLGCCFGNDLRKAVFDGWPVQNAIASDLQQGFWDYGHELFKSTPETFPAAFIAGDIFDRAILAPRGAFAEKSDAKLDAPLKELTSLTPLQGKVSAIHASSFFHLFSEEKQLELAHLVASLLLPEPGSVIFGGHVGLPEKGIRKEHARKWNMFCHSPESWRDMWMTVFDNKDGKGSDRVKVDCQLVKIPKKDHWKALMDQGDMWHLYWSVTKL